MLCKVILLLGLMAPIGWAASGPETWAARIKAGEQGNLTAQLSLGYAYAQGEVVTKDLPTAIKWYRAAAQQGDLSAGFNLGMLYRFGLVPLDYSIMADLYRVAAQQGDAVAQFKLGVAYPFLLTLDLNNFVGQVKAAHAEALVWLQKAAGQDQPDAQLLLGEWYAEGNQVEKNPVKAVQYFKQAAARNNAEAQWRLAQACLAGEGTLKNEAAATQWMRLAAEGGHRKAQAWWGSILFDGRAGLAANETEAKKWWRLADEPASPRPFRTVTEFFDWTDQPAPLDIVQAHAWFNLVASKNYQIKGEGVLMTPQIILGLVEENMTDQEKRQAEAVAQRLAEELP